MVGSRALVDDICISSSTTNSTSSSTTTTTAIPPDLLNAALAWADHRHDIHIDKQDHAEQEEGTAGPWHTSTHTHKQLLYST